MSRHYAVRDAYGTIHDQTTHRGEVLDAQKAYGGMVVQTKRDDGLDWKPYRRHRVFLWVFLAVQAGFLIWLISGSTVSTGPTAAQIAQYCGHGAWQGLFTSYADCVRHGAVGLKDAGNLGKGLGLVAVVITWLIVDFLLAVTYGIYRLARR